MKIHHLWAVAGLTALLAPLARPASAHFVWLERSADGPVQACFGDYPTDRETEALLEKIAAVKISAVTATDRTALTTRRGAAGYEVTPAHPAPVYAGELQYGQVQHGEAEPYELRYESLLLTGDGPQTLATLAERAGYDTGLTLQVGLTPLEPGAVQLSVRHDDQPIAAQVLWQQPGDFEETTGNTDAAGNLRLAVRQGLNYLRILHVERTAETFTKTYLLLSFDAALEAEPECVELLAEAQAAQAFWPADFAGFTATARLQGNGVDSTGKVTVRPDGTVDYAFDQPAAQAALQPTFDTLVRHRLHRPAAPTHRATWLDLATGPAGRAIALQDAHDSVARVRNKQIVELQRRVGEGILAIQVIANDSTAQGYLPRFWTVSQYDNGGRLTAVTTLDVKWTWAAGLFYPTTLHQTDLGTRGTRQLSLTLSDLQPLG